MPTPIKVVVTRGDIPKVALDMLQDRRYVLDIWNSLEPMPREELLKRVVDARALLCSATDLIDEELIKTAGRQLTVVATMSGETDHIDVNALAARDVRSACTRWIVTDAAAEFTVALLLATSRRLLEADKAMRADEWKAWSPSFMCGPSLTGSTVGIVGLGRLGTRVAQMLKAFSVARILYTSRSDKKESLSFAGVRANLEYLLAKSDFVIVTTDLTPETREMFNAEAFRKMKNTAIFVNVSREQIVDLAALLYVLKNHMIRAAGLAVVTPELIPSELLKLDNCVVMPHLGSGTITTRLKMAKITAENIMSALDDLPVAMADELFVPGI